LFNYVEGHLMCSAFVYGVHRLWAKKHRRSLLVAAGLVGGGTALYYGVRYLGLDSQSRKERDAARTATLQKEAEDRAEAQYVHQLLPDAPVYSIMSFVYYGIQGHHMHFFFSFLFCWIDRY
jgi:hypothetical protein